jgi:hypothetical protein
LSSSLLSLLPVHEVAADEVVLLPLLLLMLPLLLLLLPAGA